MAAPNISITIPQNGATVFLAGGKVNVSGTVDAVCSVSGTMGNTADDQGAVNSGPANPWSVSFTVQPGQYTVTMTATNAGGNGQAQISITVRAGP
jgi:hypothetical protein